MKIILASSSPRRAEILRNAGIDFGTWPTDVDETPLPGEGAAAMVARLAEAKARAASTQSDSPIHQDTGSLILGADTTVELDGEILGKPENSADAREMLRKLSGRAHRVLTGVFLLQTSTGASRAAVETTTVTFAELSEEEIDAYIGTSEPFGKAGAYAIQGVAGRYISGISGCYYNVVGLPLARVYSLLRGLDAPDKK